MFLNNGRLLHHLTNLKRRLSAILVSVCTIFSSGEIVSSRPSSMSFSSWGLVELENQRCSTSMISYNTKSNTLEYLQSYLTSLFELLPLNYIIVSLTYNYIFHRILDKIAKPFNQTFAESMRILKGLKIYILYGILK